MDALQIRSERLVFEALCHKNNSTIYKHRYKSPDVKNLTFGMMSS